MGCRDAGLPKQITKKKLIIVEGKDEVHFFNVLLNHMGITDVDVWDVAGKSKFRKQIPALIRVPGFSNLEYFAVIRDADDSPENAFKSMKDLLERNALQAPERAGEFTNDELKIGIYIIPSSNQQGMLEDLCLKTVDEDILMECVNNLIDCAKEKKDLKKISKIKSQVFIAIKGEEPVRSIGIATEKRCWNLNSRYLNDLKKFLEELK